MYPDNMYISLSTPTFEGTDEICWLKKKLPTSLTAFSSSCLLVKLIEKFENNERGRLK